MTTDKKIAVAGIVVYGVFIAYQIRQLRRFRKLNKEIIIDPLQPIREQEAKNLETIRTHPTMIRINEILAGYDNN